MLKSILPHEMDFSRVYLGVKYDGGYMKKAIIVIALLILVFRACPEGITMKP